MHQGSLSTETMAIPFLFASRHLADDAVTQLRTAHLELDDLSTTIFELLGERKNPASIARIPPTHSEMARHAIAKTRFRKYSARGRMSQHSKSTSFTFNESQSTFDLTVREPKSTWPPDRISIRLGEMGYTYNPDADGFPKDSPCSFKKLDDSREWTCSFKVERSKRQTVWARAERIPNANGASTWSRSLPVTSGPTNVKIGASRLVCATPESVKVRVKGRAGFGFTYGQLSLRAKDVNIPLAGLDAEAALVPSPERYCPADRPLAESCPLAKAISKIDTQIAFPLRHQNYAAYRWSRSLRPTATNSPLELVLRACSHAGHCEDKVIATEAEYTEAVARGCAVRSTD